MGWFTDNMVKVGFYPDPGEDSKTRAALDDAMECRRRVVERCGADTPEDPRVLAPWFDGREGLEHGVASLRDLFACIDSLERRVAELEGKAKPQ